MRHLLCLSLLLLPAVADDDPRRMKPGHAPTPFTAEEIRAACPEGRTSVFRGENEGQVVVTTMKFAKCDEKGAEIEISLAKEDGTPVRNDRRTSAWRELQAHASFPEKDTKITEETIESPAGKFDCWVYTLTQSAAGKEMVLTFHFAKTLAGPPVRMLRTLDGNVVASMALIECTMPGKKEEAPDPRRIAPGHAPTPFTADEIRKACPEGRTDTYRVEDFGPVKVKTVRFGACDDDGARMETTVVKEDDGTELGSQAVATTWKEMQANASFPEKDTKITEEAVETPAGKFDCVLYTRVEKDSDGETITTRAYFAKRLPGPPVKLIAETGGRTILAMTLLDHTEPAGDGK